MNFPKFVTVTLFFICQLTFAQDFTFVDDKVKSYPKFAKPELLAQQINKDFSSETDRARAIFSWIAFNIEYDLIKYFSGSSLEPIAFSYRTAKEKEQKLQQFNLEIVNETFRSRKAVCHGYVELYNHLAKLCRLESVLVPGTSKSHPMHIGQFPTVADHAWNAVKIDGNWKLLDVTWAAGGVDSKTNKFVPKFNDSYFFADPNEFFLNHFPADTKMLLIKKTSAEFAALPLFHAEYFQMGIEISTPEAGIIQPTDSLAFQINNLSEPRISYLFSDENQFHRVMPEQDGQNVKFDIPIDRKRSGFLTIFVNSKSIVTYKIGRG